MQSYSKDSSNLIRNCRKRVAERDFKVFGVVDGERCFSGADAHLTYGKYGQVPLEQCVHDVKDAPKYRMKVYRFSK